MSTGEWGRICKRLLHQTPFEYLNAYRVVIVYSTKHKMRTACDQEL
nr:hypothetical protein [uncultured Blautia sp.]